MKYKIYEKLITECFHSLVEAHDKSKDVLNNDCHQMLDNRHCLEINVPRHTGKTNTLINLAYQYQKVIFITINDPMKKMTNDMFPEANLEIYYIGNLRALESRLIGRKLEDYIFILDEVSLREFYTKIEKCYAINNLVAAAGVPIFSVLTYR